MVAGKLRTLAAAVFAFCAMAAAASAQVTGTVTGTVKDPQGGVIPGAAVTLTSDTRGTKLPDVFTERSGDFTFVNVPPDKYTVQVTMQGFKPAKQSGVSRQPRRPPVGRRLHDRDRRPDRHGRRQGGDAPGAVAQR